MALPSAIRALRERHSERVADFEVIALEAIADLLAKPFNADAMDQCAEKIAFAFTELNSIERRQLRERMADVRRLSAPRKADATR